MAEAAAAVATVVVESSDRCEIPMVQPIKIHWWLKLRRWEGNVNYSMRLGSFFFFSLSCLILCFYHSAHTVWVYSVFTVRLTVALASSLKRTHISIYFTLTRWKSFSPLPLSHSLPRFPLVSLLGVYTSFKEIVGGKRIEISFVLQMILLFNFLKR